MFSTIDTALLERVLVGGSLAIIAVAVAFGPEIRRHVTRLRNRGRVSRPVLSGSEASLGVESSAS